jgi:cellobiose phosphorylase
VDPCIPKDWTKFEVTRRFRDSIYEIRVRNPHHVSKGIKDATVDGKKVKTSLIPSFTDGKRHTAQITMG